MKTEIPKQPSFEQDFYYNDWKGKLLGNKERERYILEILSKVKSNESFLDIGCSEGHFVEKMKHCKKCVGIDVDEKYLENAKKRFAKGVFLKMNATKLDFKNKEFDWILCTEVLEHIPNYKKALKEMSRVNKKFLLITIPLEKALWWNTIRKLGFPKETRGHVHALIVKDIEKNLPQYKLVKKKFIATPSQRLNKRFFSKVREKRGIFAILLFEKQPLK